MREKIQWRTECQCKFFLWMRVLWLDDFYPNRILFHHHRFSRVSLPFWLVYAVVEEKHVKFDCTIDHNQCFFKSTAQIYFIQKSKSKYKLTSSGPESLSDDESDAAAFFFGMIQSNAFFNNKRKKQQPKFVWILQFTQNTFVQVPQQSMILNQTIDTEIKWLAVNFTYFFDTILMRSTQ